MLEDRGVELGFQRSKMLMSVEVQSQKQYPTNLSLFEQAKAPMLSAWSLDFRANASEP
jgi:hypothetical protein